MGLGKQRGGRGRSDQGRTFLRILEVYSGVIVVTFRAVVVYVGAAIICGTVADAPLQQNRLAAAGLRCLVARGVSGGTPTVSSQLLKTSVFMRMSSVVTPKLPPIA